MQVTRTGNTATGGASGSAKPAQSLTYMHHDHLGSVSVLTDDSGSVLQDGRLAYDPWGKRRFPNGLADTTDSIVGLTLDRGFTMHEHLDEMGVIHMNGRIYDPLIGRFMSADPFIPDASNLQAHNRFAYVYNNPLKFTDPDGFKPFWKKKWFRALVAVAVGAWTMGAVSGAILNGASLSSGLVAATGYSTSIGLTSLGTALAGAAGGFMAGLVGSGSLKGAFQGAFTGGVFGAIGGIAANAESAWGTGQFVAAHAAGGCITSVASGGSCGSGALSAAFGKFTTLQTQDWGAGVGQFSASVVAGGVGSVIGGGKFSNGAATAAYAYIFNNCQSVGCFREIKAELESRLLRVQNALRSTWGVEKAYEGRNVAAGSEVGAMIGPIGGSYAAVRAVDTNQNMCTVQQACVLVGAGLFVGAKAVTQASTGNLSSGAVDGLALFGEGGAGPFAKVTPLQVNLDGSVSGQVGYGKGAGAGAGIKFCKQTTECN